MVVGGVPAKIIREMGGANSVKNDLMELISFCLVFCLLLSGCGMADARDSSQDDSTVSGEEATETALQPEGEAAMHTYSTQEIWVQNGDLRIYGIAYVPETDGKMPLVIFSHELGPYLRRALCREACGSRICSVCL